MKSDTNEAIDEELGQKVIQNNDEGLDKNDEGLDKNDEGLDKNDEGLDKNYEQENPSPQT